MARRALLQRFGLQAGATCSIQRMDSPSTSSSSSTDSAAVQLTTEQQHVFDRVVTKAMSGEGGCFFVDGRGGAGKTMTFRKIVEALEKAGKKVACCAFTGIAASLLPNGYTSHHLFSIPVPCDRITPLNPIRVDLLKQLDAIIWDEASMCDGAYTYLVDEAMQRVRGCSQPFGGVTMVFGGDWRQILPIVPGVSNAAIPKWTLRAMYFWAEIEHLSLTKNMRAAADPHFADFVDRVGQGEAEEVEIPQCCLRDSEEALIQSVFGEPGTAAEKQEVFCKSAILAVDNLTTVLKLLDGPQRDYEATDISTDPQISVQELHNLLPSGFPPHRLSLKVGAVVMLLRNMDLKKGQCNGARFIYIVCSPVDPLPHCPKVVTFRRRCFTDTARGFSRHQFPLRLAFVITCNKAQGQTLERCGVLLNRSCFSHGQLYVAVSRARTMATLFVHIPGGGTTARNVVIRCLVEK